MSYTATSHQEVAAQKLRRMLALSSTFQLLCGEDYAGTLRKVQLLESDGCFPRASVVITGTRWYVNSGGDRNHMRLKTSLALSVDIQPDNTLDEQERLDKGFDQLFKIFNEINELAGVDDTESTSSHLSIIDSSILSIDEVPPERRESEGVFYWMDAVFEVGDGD